MCATTWELKSLCENPGIRTSGVEKTSLYERSRSLTPAAKSAAGFGPVNSSGMQDAQMTRFGGRDISKAALKAIRDARVKKMIRRAGLCHGVERVGGEDTCSLFL